MLPGVDSKVVQRMPVSALNSIEAALALKLAHAQVANALNLTPYTHIDRRNTL